MLVLGDEAILDRCFGPEALADFEALGGKTGDPDHIPEPLITGLFSYLLGVRLPGRGTNYLKQETEFVAPARWDEPLTAKVAICRIRPEKFLVDLETLCTGDGGRVIARGRALVYVQDVEGAFATPDP